MAVAKDTTAFPRVREDGYYCLTPSAWMRSVTGIAKP